MVFSGPEPPAQPRRAPGAVDGEPSGAAGPRTIGGQARPADGLRPRATNDRKPSTTPVRATPAGHKRPAITRTQQTACAAGPRTIGGQARPADGSRPRATNDRKPSTTPARLPPAGHKRPAVRRAQQTACAPGPQTIESRAQHPYGCRRRATNDRRSGAPSRRLAPPGHKRSKAKHNTRTAAAGGPRTAGGRACPENGLRPRATNDNQCRAAGLPASVSEPAYPASDRERSQERSE
ncbi:hypothetical protein MLP_42000 [Microlunatus phosphovorus NM-1]|uniref:Uncharacterized protein n=1 Tax=Microlunatus phosphovorus (strain ATCC 700054 / DSM 10555 / JCM 9379 / NBRC 101784 / NCIMB 13414 / VKM Ac-1990 / NM-1) TaxID=1032480 RepID=F5XS01_MICPN|nr:hypothetical protein MLP_42000 [Microlunatus phosphovorus NM-1]